MNRKGSIFKGALLVAGTSIGGGMLALPILTSLGGFVPSLVIYLLCWVFMASTGLLVLEVCHWLEGETNFLSMAEKTLGVWAKWGAAFVYIFLFYSLTVAYVVGCGEFFMEISGERISHAMGSLLFVLLFAPLILAGAIWVERINVFLVFGLISFFFIFVALGFSHVDHDNLQPRNWPLALIAMPIAFTSFAYQGIVPTLSYTMNHNVKKTRIAILIGSFIPFVTYVVWQWLILGIVPAGGPSGLAEALEKGQSAIIPLKNAIQNPNVFFVGECFAFFALTTSFYGVTLGLFDFLADGLKIEKKGRGKWLILFLVFAPPLVIGITYPGIFLKALSAAGGLGCALLLGLLPILMVWSGRYRHKFNSETALPGGRLVLSLLLAFVLFELYIEIFY